MAYLIKGISKLGENSLLVCPIHLQTALILSSDDDGIFYVIATVNRHSRLLVLEGGDECAMVSTDQAADILMFAKEYINTGELTDENFKYYLGKFGVFTFDTKSLESKYEDISYGYADNVPMSHTIAQPLGEIEREMVENPSTHISFNGYDIRFNPYGDEFQVSHVDIGANLESFKWLENAIDYATKG